MATYSITPSSESVLEGNTLSFVVSTIGVVDDTTLYWTITGTNITNSDLTDLYGEFNILSSTGAFFIDASTDVNLEGTEYFNVQVRTVSTTGSIVAVSSPIALYDATEPNTPHGTVGITDGKFSYVFNDNTYIITGTQIILG